ncbi:P-loop containing nucleoside triphosphate hydrolase protein [Aspergillus sclerotioniger CBS 115572]|uniref:DNA 3'-5' helicase n=1 Tax=Aspergillus sclerotioniger CBS 115572 TaxID=1450535 RepID=A0A317XBY2_9EURO|nr:P-loop containing nucleoside triphosphate hydrolase protein [Aspergillus sclerotioniger CBS 115572]PWY94468.1 P-loop containing nucleoside triphosphate hydrolase protein [Aspergillus sclerotioniger CBS 115572]
MRNKTYHPYPVNRQNVPYKRRAVAQLPTPSRSNPTTIIDQRLVEGAQEPFLHRPPREVHRSYVSEPQMLPRDDSLELDAFADIQTLDLELLAQSDEQTRSLQAAGLVTDRGSLPSRPSQATNYNQVSRFFHAGPHVTPHQSLGSSSSDTGVRSPSSPLVRLRAERMNVQSRQHNLEARDVPHTSYDYGKSCPHSTEILPTASHGRPKSPFKQIPVSIRGIVLVSVHELPDKYRPMFPFPVFNAVQSKCFHPVYKTDSNIVLSAPTGSGKTVIMELAICRLLNCLKDERFKVVYQAPTKSLCSERFRDWNTKFHTLGLQCAELTGDTDPAQLRRVQNSQIIITTPEKWDSMTRKWKDHARLMQLVKLSLIDEVHILKEARGATLEAVVSRMKTNGSNVRFVALSATVPNSEDISTWLGRDSTNQHVPAHREHFGEDFRPVKLQKFVYGYQSHANDFAFDKMCGSKLPDLIASHSSKKPIMIFCCTRNSAVATAKELARLWSMSNPPARLWKGPGRPMEVQNMDLKSTIGAGVAFHHAGLDPGDRRSVETGFLQGLISIICCTSTLAVGVNLPCHLVIIKGTAGWQEGGCKEYSDLDIMQMLGRAGRPQFDDSATAVIMTRKERENHYEKLVSGSQSLESCLHLNLVDHLNAEIGLGNVTNIDSAIRWLAGTFLFVRMRRNPTHYHLKEDADRGDEDEMLRQVCEKDIKLLQECGLVSTDGLRSTNSGDAMARYYVRFETMRTLLTLKPHSSISQVLSVISRADEFREIRLKAGEKSLYKEINRASAIRFPVNVDIALPAHKISLLIQSELGAVDLPDGELFQKHKFAFQQDKTFVFSHINRLIRCVIDCQVGLEDSITLRNALELARSFGAKVWDDSPLQMKQIEQIGVVAVRKLASAGITSIEALELCEPHQIDMTLSRNPPFGRKLLDRLVDFPKLRVSIKMTGKDSKPGNAVKIQMKAEVAFMNPKSPTYFQRRPVYICFLAETSDGRLLDFRRISASKMSNGQEILLAADLKSAGQFVTCYAMCDDIAGTTRSAQLKPDIPASLFPAQLDSHPDSVSTRPQPNISRRRSNDTSQTKYTSNLNINTWDSDDLLFDEFLEKDEAENWSCTNKLPESSGNKARNKSKNESKYPEKAGKAAEAEEPTRLENGRWACNHRCKDKTTRCKHLCCRDGLEKPPKASKKRLSDETKGLNQMTLPATIVKKNTHVASISSTEVCANHAILSGPTPKPSHKSKTDNSDKARINPSAPARTSKEDSSSEYGDDSFSDFPSPSALLFDYSATPTKKDLEPPTNEGELDLNDDWIDDEIWLDPGSPPPDSSPAGQSRVIIEKVSQDETTHASQSVHTAIPKTNPENPDSQVDNLPTFDISHGKKRNLPPTTNSDSMSKKCKTDKATTGTDKSQSNNDIVTSGSVPSEPVHETSTIPEGWEDIDRDLLDEFKDIINLF